MTFPRIARTTRRIGERRWFDVVGSTPHGVAMTVLTGEIAVSATMILAAVALAW